MRCSRFFDYVMKMYDLFHLCSIICSTNYIISLNLSLMTSSHLCLTEYINGQLRVSSLSYLYVCNVALMFKFIDNNSHKMSFPYLQLQSGQSGMQI